MTFYLLWLHPFVLDLGFWPFTLGYQMHIILGLTLQAMSYTKKAVFSRLENLWRWNLQNHLQSLRLAPKGTLRYSKENKIHINVWVFRNLQVGLYLWHRVTVGLNLIFSVFLQSFCKVTGNTSVISQKGEMRNRSLQHRLKRRIQYDNN